VKGLSVVFSAICFFLALTGPAVSGEEKSKALSADAAVGNPAQEAGRVIAARVNGVEITEASVVKMMNHMGAKKGQNGTGFGDTENLRKEALDRLIFQELAYQKAKGENMTADPKKVDDALAVIKTNLGGGDEYGKFLEKEGVTEAELRAQVEKSLILDHIFSREVREKASVSEDAIKKEYEQNKDALVKHEKIAVIDVVFFLDMKDAVSVRKAETVLHKIQDDKDKNPQNLVSDGTFVVRDMLLAKNNEPVLYEAAKKLATGQLSGVLRTADSIHIIKLMEYVPEKRYTFDEVRNSLETKLKAQEQKKRLREWEGELRMGARIEVAPTSVKTPEAGKNKQ
jgi:parvulin-like peptidyl-prolyl isomerase